MPIHFKAKNWSGNLTSLVHHVTTCMQEIHYITAVCHKVNNYYAVYLTCKLTGLRGFLRVHFLHFRVSVHDTSCYSSSQPLLKYKKALFRINITIHDL